MTKLKDDIEVLNMWVSEERKKVKKLESDLMDMTAKANALDALEEKLRVAVEALKFASIETASRREAAFLGKEALADAKKILGEL